MDEEKITQYKISLGEEGTSDLIIECSPSERELTNEEKSYTSNWPKVCIRKKVNCQYTECLTGVPAGALFHAIRVAKKYGKDEYISQKNNISWPGKKIVKFEIAKKIWSFLGDFAYLFEREQGKGTHWIGSTDIREFDENAANRVINDRYIGNLQTHTLRAKCVNCYPHNNHPLS